MLDTVAIENRYGQAISLQAARRFKWRKLFNTRTGELRGYTLQGRKGEHLPTLTCTLRKNGFWYLRAEVCFPKWLYGSNVRTLSDNEIPSALVKLSRYVSELSGKNFDAETGNVARADFVEDRRIDEINVIEFFKKIRDLRIQTMRRDTFEETSVNFHPKTVKRDRVIKIYSKQHEVLNNKGTIEEIQLSRGQIRLEILLRTRKISAIVKSLCLPSREAKYFLSSQVAEYVLSKEKQILGYERLFTKEQNTLKIVLDSPDIKSPFSILGFFEVYKSLGKDFYKLESAICSKRTYYLNRSKCRKIGLIP